MCEETRAQPSKLRDRLGQSIVEVIHLRLVTSRFQLNTQIRLSSRPAATPSVSLGVVNRSGAIPLVLVSNKLLASNAIERNSVRLLSFVRVNKMIFHKKVLLSFDRY